MGLTELRQTGAVLCIVVGSLIGRRDTGLGRNTIARILGQEEVKSMLAAYYQQILELVPAALIVCERNLRSQRPSWRLAVQILKATQVLATGQKHEVSERHDELAQLTDEQLRDLLRTGEMPAAEPGDPCQRVA